MTQSENTHRLAVATKALLTLLLVVAVVWGYDTCVGKKDRDQYPVTNSNWDSSVPQAEAYIKAHLANPESYTSLRWGTVIQMPNGDYRVSHRFRAKDKNGQSVVVQMNIIFDKNGKVKGTHTIDTTAETDNKEKSPHAEKH